MSCIVRLVRASVVIGVVGGPAALLAQTDRAEKVGFDVASVRVVEKPTPQGARRITDSRVDLLSVPMNELLRIAYEVETFRLVTPEWLREEPIWLDIQATLPPGADRQQVPGMLRQLLVDRFDLVARFEPRSIDLGELTLGPDGLKMIEVQPADDRKKPYPAVPGGAVPFEVMTGRPANQTRLIYTGRATREITARTNYEWTETERGTRIVDAARISMGQLRDVIQSSIGKPVFDRTGLTGFYQFRIELPRNMAQEARWAERLGTMTNRNGEPIVPRPIDDAPSSASVFKAVEQLGLQLQERRAPFDVLIVERLLKAPKPN